MCTDTALQIDFEARVLQCQLHYIVGVCDCGIQSMPLRNSERDCKGQKSLKSPKHWWGSEAEVGGGGWFRPLGLETNKEEERADDSACCRVAPLFVADGTLPMFYQVQTQFLALHNL